VSAPVLIDCTSSHGVQMRETPAPRSDLSIAVERLAALGALEYDRLRKSEAEALGVRLATLDDAVKGARPKDDLVSASGGRALSLPDTEPWPDPVSGAAVLDDVSAAFIRHLALPTGAADALALWCAYTHAFEAFPISPRLAITSPEKRCGKTTLLRMLAMVCERVLQAANITPAAMFRAIELARPTLLVDEADTFLEGREELRGVLNSGHARDGCVIRTVGDDHEPRQFSTWAPCAIAMIGRLPDTLADRSIAVPMRRRVAGEGIERLRFDRPQQFEGQRRRLARFMLGARRTLESCDPDMPAQLHDRAADNWRVLFAIADAAGGDWPARVRVACLALNVGETDADTIGATLLRDVQASFALRGNPVRLSSADLCQALADDEASQWAAFGRSEKAITPAALARLLKRFKIGPKVMRNGANVWRGYEREAFADAWSRYLAPDAAPQSVTPLQALKDKGLKGDATRDAHAGVTPSNAPEVLAGQEMLRCNGSNAIEPCDTRDGADRMEVTL
jgi:putative DNA primase/helicase